MENDHIAFLPFHAINEFMRPDYRQAVLQTTLHSLAGLPEEQQASINKMIKNMIKIPGFRNSTLAPVPLKVRAAVPIFEKNPDFVAVVLSAWSEIHPELRQQVYDMLVGRGWEILPPEADRTQLPGFMTRWPAGEDFDVLNKAYAEAYPSAGTSSDDVALMTVWLAGMLPYEKETGAESPSE